jgi:hypothetical protein
LIADLFIIAKATKMSSNRGMDNRSDYQATKRPGGKKCTLLSDRCQYEKPTNSMIPPIQHSGKGRTTETMKDQWLSRIGGCGQEERKDERVAHRKFLRQ